MDLSDCSRLLYHWAISPTIGFMSLRCAQSNVGQYSTCAHRVPWWQFVTLFCDNAKCSGNINVSYMYKRRWYNGQHSCLPSSWSGFDSRPTHNFSLYFNHKDQWNKMLLYLPWPGFEPGLLRPQRRVLTTRRSRLRKGLWNVANCQGSNASQWSHWHNRDAQNEVA